MLMIFYKTRSAVDVNSEEALVIGKTFLFSPFFLDKFRMLDVSKHLYGERVVEDKDGICFFFFFN